MRIAIHVSHEALYKIGGIGEVLIGLCTAPSYQVFFEKTLLYGPLFEYIGSPSARLGKDGIVYFSSRDHYDTGHFGELFKPLLEKYQINIVFGKRRLISELNPQRVATVDVLLVDVTQMRKELVDFQKYLFWEKFGLPSDRYERDWDYEQYFRLSLPYYEFLKLLYPKTKEFYHFGHEFMGIPSLLALELNPSFNEEKHIRVFYAHEVSPARRIVENHPGQDISFYNLLKKGKPQGKTLEDIFGSQMDWYRTALVKLTYRFDRIFAVGDLVAEEYKFLVREINPEKVKVVYNGLPLNEISFKEKEMSRKKFETCLGLKGCERVDVLLSHTCRLVKSKGIWRDIKSLWFLDKYFEKAGLKGIFILLGSQIPHGRPVELVEAMVKEYGWPFNHRIGWPDLIGYEIDIYQLIEKFNQHSKNIKTIFINQYGLSKRKCGIDFPEDITTRDLKLASDVEFGLSIYEPFGISHIEVLPPGGISILSTSCGVFYLLEKIFKEDFKPYIAIDFIGIGKDLPEHALLELSHEKREILEELAIAKCAENIFKAIPKNQKERIETYEKIQFYLKELDWDNILKKYFLPSLF